MTESVFFRIQKFPKRTEVDRHSFLLATIFARTTIISHSEYIKVNGLFFLVTFFYLGDFFITDKCLVTDFCQSFSRIFAKKLADTRSKVQNFETNPCLIKKITSHLHRSPGPKHSENRSHTFIYKFLAESIRLGSNHGPSIVRRQCYLLSALPPC